MEFPIERIRTYGYIGFVPITYTGLLSHLKQRVVAPWTMRQSLL